MVRAQVVGTSVTVIALTGVVAAIGNGHVGAGIVNARVLRTGIVVVTVFIEGAGAANGIQPVHALVFDTRVHRAFVSVVAVTVAQAAVDEVHGDARSLHAAVQGAGVAILAVRVLIAIAAPGLLYVGAEVELAEIHGTFIFVVTVSVVVAAARLRRVIAPPFVARIHGAGVRIPAFRIVGAGGNTLWQVYAGTALTQVQRALVLVVAVPVRRAATRVELVVAESRQAYVAGAVVAIVAIGVFVTGIA